MCRDGGKKELMVWKILHILKDLHLFSVEGRLLRVDVIKCWKKFLSKYGICPEDKFVLARGSITRGHRFGITPRIFSMDCKRRSFFL